MSNEKVETPSPVPSIKDTMSEVFDRIAARESEKTEELQESVAEETVEESVEDAEGVGVAEDTIIPPLEAEGDEEEVEQESASEETGDEIKPLEHWKRDIKEKFADLEPWAQQFVIDRDKEFQASVTGKQMEVADIKRALEPVRADLEREGVSDAQAVRYLIAAHLQLKEKPKETLKWLAERNGIDISFNSTDDEEGRSDLSDSAAMREVKKLREELGKEREARQAAEADKVSQTIAEFAESHEHFDEVVNDMTVIANGYRARNQEPPPLEEIYNKACRLNDSVWSKIQKKRHKELAEKEKEDAQRAKAASGTKVTSTPRRSSGGKPEKKTLRQELADNFDKIAQAR